MTTLYKKAFFLILVFSIFLVLGAFAQESDSTLLKKAGFGGPNQVEKNIQ